MEPDAVRAHGGGEAGLLPDLHLISEPDVDLSRPIIAASQEIPLVQMHNIKVRRTMNGRPIHNI
jgi:hypothetical protein